MNSFIISVDSSFEMTNHFFELLLSNEYVKKNEVIVIVDGNDSYRLREYLSLLTIKHENMVVEYVDKVGYGIANNLAVSRATGKTLFFINTDVFVKGDCFELIENALNSGMGDCVQPLLLYPQTNMVQCAGTFFGNHFKDHLFDGNKPNAKIVKKSGMRQALTSALYVMKKETFEEFEGFDPFYFNKLESFELSYKLSLSGKKCYYLADAVAYHSRGGGRSQYVFDFSQQDAYFWSRYGNTVKPDIQKFILEQLEDTMLNHSYFALYLNQHRDWPEILNGIPINLSEVIDKPWIDYRGINLFDVLPYSFLRTSTPLLFIVNNISQLRSNRYWFTLRDNPLDIAMDNFANLVYVQDYLA